MDDYLEALFKEMDAAADSFAGRQLQTVYTGGGTPTTLEPSQMDRLLTQIETHFDLSGCLEFTVEAGRPDSITQDKLQVLREHRQRGGEGRCAAVTSHRASAHSFKIST